MSNNSTSPSSAAGSQTTTTSNDGGTTSNIDHITSPVTIIPLITTVMLLCSIIVAAFMIYRRRKRLQVLNELVHANKRIRVVSTDLEKAKDDPKEMTKVVKTNITKTTKGNHDDTLKPPPLPPRRKISVTATTRRRNPPVMRFNPYEHPRSFKVSQPIHVTTSDTTVHDNNPGYTSMEVNCNDTPSIVAFRPRTTHNQVTFAGLLHHYNKMGTSAEGLSRIHINPPISPPPIPMRNTRLGYKAPENTFQDTTLDVTSASHRTIYGSEELDISVATSLAFYPNNVRKNPIDYEPVQSKYTELEHWV